MWVPEVSVAERLVRAIAGYFFLIVLFRIAGKRQVGQLTAVDLVVLMLVSNVMQNAMIGSDNSIGGGMIGVGAIMVLNGLIAFAASRNRRLERLVEGSPTLLVRDGVVDMAALRREFLSLEDLRAALRENGLLEPHEARFVMLEPTGRITVGRRRGGP